MTELDKYRGKLTFKLVYYGPAFSGKTTNLMHLHNTLPQRNTGEIMLLDTKRIGLAKLSW